MMEDFEFIAENRQELSEVVKKLAKLKQFSLIIKGELSESKRFIGLKYGCTNSPFFDTKIKG